MRVLMLSWEYPPVVVGGLGRHVTALSAELARAGHEVTVLTREGAGAPAQETVGGVRVLRAPEGPPTVPMTDLLAWTLAFNHGLVRTALRADIGPVDVVHAHDWLVAHAAVSLAQHLHAPLVSTIHATEAGRHQGWLPGPLSQAVHGLEGWLTHESRRVLTCSEYMRREVTRLFELTPEAVDVAPNGTQLRAFRASLAARSAARARLAAGASPLIVFSGRLEWEKGVHVLLPAFARLRRHFPGALLVIAGEGTQRQSLTNLAQGLRLGRRVVFAGALATPDLAALLGTADVAVTPSLYEPFGLVALEAAAAGAPRVVSSTGGLRELVEDGVTGLCVPPGDPGALATALRRVLDDEVSARRMARTARARLGPLSWRHAAEQVALSYARAIREETAQPGGFTERAVPRARPVLDGNLLLGLDA